ncbi:MAG: Type 1 glutamine amidotransferase-like domain-containing protein [Polyangiaceae bacterium]
MRGRILLNGNAETSGDLVRGARALLLGSRHVDPEVAAARRVLLITTAWRDEHDEAHVKRDINALGLASSFDGGFDRTIVNLSLGAEMRAVLEASPSVRDALTEIRATRDRARQLYLAHNGHLVTMVRRVVAEARPLLDAADRPTLSTLADAEHAPSGGDARSLYRFTLARELRHLLETLAGNDDRMVELSAHIDEEALDAIGVPYAAGWKDARDRLAGRILGANSIVLFGGNLDALLEALRFFRLRDVLFEALRRGASIVGTSAGAMVLGERIIVYDDYREREFQLWERGLGLVRGIQLFPHCMERIQTDDPDNLAYLARRFRHRVSVGLNAGSFLLADLEARRLTSTGDADGVYVFGPTGEKRRLDAGSTIDAP